MIIEWIKSKAIIIEAIIIVGLIIYIAVSKNITINEYTTNSSQSISNAYSSSAALNQTMVYDSFRMQGKWEIKDRGFESHTEVIKFYNTLNPIQMMFVKETFMPPVTWVITYPEISDIKLEDKKESKPEVTQTFKKR